MHQVSSEFWWIRGGFILATRHVGHCWRSKGELISDVLMRTPSHGRANVWRPARTYIQFFYADTGCSLEDLLGAMDDRDGWRERVRKIRTGSVTWWWWILERTKRCSEKKGEGSRGQAYSVLSKKCPSGIYLFPDLR